MDAYSGHGICPIDHYLQEGKPMDPHATLRLYCEAFADGDQGQWYEALDNLDRWIRKGGFVDQSLACRLVELLASRSFELDREMRGAP